MSYLQTIKAKIDDVGKLKFVVFGDTPYRPFEKKLVGEVYPLLMKKERHEFLIHYGDIKKGNVACTNENILGGLDLIKKVYPGQTLYTPGDNDWTDCDRDLATRYSELERLDFLRGNLWEPSSVFKERSSFERQPEQPENARWAISGVHFVTLHVVGGNNGRDEILVDSREEILKAVKKRDLLNMKWLEQSVARAQKEKARAFVVIFHGDIYINEVSRDYPLKECDGSTPFLCDGHMVYRHKFASTAKLWKKPFLIIHGDTSEYCLEKNFKNIPNLWRLNGPGDYDVSDMTEVIFDFDREEFFARGMLTRLAPPMKCVYDKADS